MDNLAHSAAAVGAVAAASLESLRSAVDNAVASLARAATAHPRPTPPPRLRKAHASDNDLRRPTDPTFSRRTSSTSDEPSSLHERALAAARAAEPTLRDVAAMRFVYVDEDAVGPNGEAVVVIVPAHFRAAALTRRELLLHAVLVAHTALGTGRSYIIVLHGDGAEGGLTWTYDASLFSELHLALPPAHRHRLAAFYVLAPPLPLRLWLLGLRLSEPSVYSRAIVVASLADLARRFGGGTPPAPPECAARADAERAAEAEREGRI